MVFGGDPTQFLTALDIRVPDWFDTTRTAVLDAEHTSRVNHDVFVFASDESKARFDEDPVAQCGTVRDPVTLVAFRPLEASPTLLHEDRWFVFESEASRAAFVADVDSFAVPRWGMRPMDGGPIDGGPMDSDPTDGGADVDASIQLAPATTGES